MAVNPFPPDTGDPAANLLLHALYRMNPVTANPVDRALAGMLLREARRTGCYPAVRDALMAGRAEYRVWLFCTQRHWQAHTRRPARADHRDSVSIRERYVRVQP